MSISSIGSNYNSYYSNATQTNTQQTQYKAQYKQTSNDILNNYKQKYSELNFSAGYNTKGAGSTGLGNVILHPNLLKKMANNPEFATKVENNIKYIPQAEAWKKNMCAANGMNLVSSGCFVDENGNIAGSWSQVKTANGNDDENEIEELLEKLRQKSLDKRIALDKLLDNNLTQQKQLEVSVQGNTNVEKVWQNAIQQYNSYGLEADFKV